MLSLELLDGTYSLQSHAPGDAHAPGDDLLIANGDGKIDIRNGMSYRKDDRGFIWESTYTITGDRHVEMTTTVDPSHAGPDAYVMDGSGNPTKGMVTYAATLTAANEDGELVLRGEIRHGGGVSALTLTKIS